MLASFSGSVEDLLVLAHEVGHELEPGPGFRDGWTGVGDPASACRAALAEVERRLTALERTFLEATGRRARLARPDASEEVIPLLRKRPLITKPFLKKPLLTK